jgi:hypothetical protein
MSTSLHTEDLELLKLIEQHCTIDQVQELLRRVKQRSEKRDARVKITAQVKNDLVFNNLSEALRTGAVARDEVFNLLRSAEENGNQHIFYFRAKTKATQEKMRLDAVGNKLLGAGWKTSSIVPNARAIEGEYHISDLRGLAKSSDWLLKIYGLSRVQRHGPIRVIDGERYLRIFDETIRVVLVARWNSPNLLEFRIPRDESRRRIADWLAVLWKQISAHVQQAEFEPWNLDTARRNLIEREDENESVYSARDTKLWDVKRDGRATFEGHVDSYDLFSRIEYRDAIMGLMKAGDKCTHLTVRWYKLKKSAVPSRELHTLLVGDREPNEMVFSGHAEAADVDYVTQKLRQFSR